MDGATRASRDSLAVVASRPAAATEAAERPTLLGRRDGQRATRTSSDRLATTASVATIGPSSTAGATIPARVQAALASDRALFTALTVGRRSLTEQADKAVARSAATLAHSADGGAAFDTLLGSSLPMPNSPLSDFHAAQQRSKSLAAAREATRGKVARAYAAAPRPPAQQASGSSGTAWGVAGTSGADPDALPGQWLDAFG